jgi:DNA invertase Pin-like site-specific DNA recombinase
MINDKGGDMRKEESSFDISSLRIKQAAGTNSIAAPLTAVLYLRVSTKDQAARGNDLEGFSIPAQRDAATRRAASLGAQIVGEFIDAGESARSADRPELQRMLKFLESNPVSFVIVHKLDRLARNRLDDVMINLALQKAGARLVSVSENVDDTPSGILLHGIMASIAEWYSSNLSQEVKVKSLEKAKNGGTPMRAPIGYLNVRKMENGQEIRTVDIDPVRGPMMAWAFDAYATGDWTLRGLLEELTKRGLISVAGPKTPSQPLKISHFHRMLRHPYYTGVVRYAGVTYAGRHEPLVSVETWNAVQDMLESKNLAGESQRAHPHYLKGSIFCGECGSRLIVNNAKGRHGGIFPYFVCVGRQKNPASCNLRALRIDVVEEQVALHYQFIRLTNEQLNDVRDFVLTELESAGKNIDHERKVQDRRIHRLHAERTKLLEAHYADALPLDLMKTEQKRIQTELETAERRLALISGDFETSKSKLLKALDLAARCEQGYRDATPVLRRTFNQAFFSKLLIDDDYTVTSELAEPFDKLLDKNLLEEASSRKNTLPIVDYDSETQQVDVDNVGVDDIFRGASEKMLVGAGRPQNFFEYPNVVGGWNPVHLVGAEGLEPPTC